MRSINKCTPNGITVEISGVACRLSSYPTKYISNPNVEETKIDLQVVVRLKMRDQWKLQVTWSMRTVLQ